METITHSVATEQCNTTDIRIPIVTNLAFADLISTKSYIAFTGSVFDHIITCPELSPHEKLYYLLADSLASISSNFGKQRAVALPSAKWATRLNCSRSQIFSLQKSLAAKGYFVIIKEKNKRGQNKRNLIVPTLPDNIFTDLCKSAVCKIGKFSFYNPTTECKRAYLDRTRLFIPLSYQLLQTITSDDRLNGLQKIVWLDLFVRGVKAKEFSLVISFTELATKHSCTSKNISKLIIGLQENQFIRAGRFLIRQDSAIQDRQDKSLWEIDLNLPPHYLQLISETRDRAKLSIPAKPAENKDYVSNVSNPDPLFSDSVPLLNKDLKIIKNKEKDIKSNLEASEVILPKKVFLSSNHKKRQQTFNVATLLIRQKLRNLPQDKVDKARKYAYSLHAKGLVKAGISKHELAKQFIIHASYWKPTKTNNLSREQEIDMALNVAWQAVVSGKWQVPFVWQQAKILQSEYEAYRSKYQHSGVLSADLPSLQADIERLTDTYLDLADKIRQDIEKLAAKQGQAKDQVTINSQFDNQNLSTNSDNSEREEGGNTGFSMTEFGEEELEKLHPYSYDLSSLTLKQRELEVITSDVPSDPLLIKDTQGKQHQFRLLTMEADYDGNFIMTMKPLASNTASTIASKIPNRMMSKIQEASSMVLLDDTRVLNDSLCHSDLALFDSRRVLN